MNARVIMTKNGIQHTRAEGVTATAGHKLPTGAVRIPPNEAVEVLAVVLVPAFVQSCCRAFRLNTHVMP